MMTYRAVQPHTKAEAEVAFAQGTREQIRAALLGVTYYVEDWRWVQAACLDWLGRSDSSLQWTAIQCLGHLATFHHALDLAIVLPALQVHLSDPALASVFYDALGDIAGVEDTSYFEQNWDELPYRIKDALIEMGAFQSQGKRIPRRNFVAIRKEETQGQVSHDQQLVEQIKRSCSDPSDHDWREYYDEQGRLRRLDLEGLGLGHLPAELWQLTFLQELDLGGNDLRTLPAEVGQLVSLEWLGLDENQLRHLPAELGQLVLMQELYLHKNQLRSLPAEVGQLVNLQKLELSENDLSSLPIEVGQLVNLLTLSLDKNEFRSLPAEVGQLLNVRTLFLDHNQLDSLPAELGQLVHLQWLSLKDNQLRSLPAELGQLAHLHTLNLNQNPQLQIPPPEVVQEGVSAVLAHLRALLSTRGDRSNTEAV